MRRTGLIVLSVLACALTQCVAFHGAFSTSKRHSARFEAGEHYYIGSEDGGVLSMIVGSNGTDEFPNPDNNIIYVNASNRLEFVNSVGLNLHTYGDIMGFAGDFFGPTSLTSVICSSSSFEDSVNLFQAAWRTMWIYPDPDYISSLMNEFRIELDAIAKANGTAPWEVYNNLGTKRWEASIFSDNSILQKLVSNFDHFGGCAAEAYKAGHFLAMHHAQDASAQLDGFEKLNHTERGIVLDSVRYSLITAYSLNAFADHYLTDLFAAGHLRTPRKAISQVCSAYSSFYIPDIVTLSESGLTAQWMHDEDNRNGLLVTNARGDVWTSYGDANYFDEKNAGNRKIISEALATSQLEVFAAFRGADFEYGALKLVPDMNMTLFTLNNTCPLFIRDPSLAYDVLVRSPVATVRSPHFFNSSVHNYTCNYVPFTDKMCPSSLAKYVSSQAWLPTSLLSTLYTVMPYGYFNDLNATLFYSEEQKAWYSNEADVSIANPGTNAARNFWMIVGIVFIGLFVVTLVGVVFLIWKIRKNRYTSLSASL